MPSANHTSDEYSSCLNVVEHLISQLTAVGPLIVAGDINAHIGSADGGQAPNNRGGMWNSLIDEYSLFTMLQLIGCQYSGPSCTYASGGGGGGGGGDFTMNDYILMNQDGSRGISTCSVIEYHLPGPKISIF